ncbi:ribosome biogenesis protein NOC4 [Pseudohyphozyma bogoriensis]|nr:ribosome biogenesis protein NOC4 [Pseudohyphozyma bogoriensis]
MPSSLPKQASKPQKSSKASTSKASSASLLSQITSLAALLPPSAPSSASLNPLADLVSLFESLPLDLPTTTPTPQKEANRQAVHAALHSLKATFELLVKGGRIHGNVKAGAVKKQKVEDDKVVEGLEKVQKWLKSLWERYLKQAAKVAVAHWDENVKTAALTALFSLFRTESTLLTSLHPSKQSQFPISSYQILVSTLLLPSDPPLLTQTTIDDFKKYLEKYDDVRYYFLSCASATLAPYIPSNDNPSPSSPPPALSSNLLTLLTSLTTMPSVNSALNTWWCPAPTPYKTSTPSTSSKKRKATSDPSPDDGSTGIFDSSSESEEEEVAAPQAKKKLLPSLLTISAHKKVFSSAWLGLLGLPLNEDECKTVLASLHRGVIPFLTDPRRLMDWLVDCLGRGGGVIPLLSLNSLFLLISKHNLDYPDFFTKLYALLDRHVLHVRYRARFFRLLETFMSSSHLPATLVAAFIKRMSRLSLSAPPAGIVTVIPFVYNLLKMHPSCMPLIHRPAKEEDEDEAEQQQRLIETDPFDPLAIDPLKSHALESSLWELATLRSHYLSSVSGLAKIFNEVMSKQNYAMEDFLDHSYSTMFESEMTRKIKNAPALAPVPQRQPIGDSFFPLAGKEAEVDEDGDELELVDIVSKLWEF